MSFFGQNNLRLTDGQLLVIDTLNMMYNDNNRQITALNNIINNLINSNNQIRLSLSQILNTNHNSNSNSNRRNRRSQFNYTYDNLNTSYFNQEPNIYNEILYSGINRPTGTYINASGQSNLLNRVLQTFLQPIEIYPTQNQIESATRRVRYSDITRPLNSRCPISLEEFNDNNIVTVIRHCGHTFHSNSIDNWFRTNCRCPVCRYDIRDYNSNTSDHFFNNTTSIDASNNTTISDQNNFFNPFVRDPSGNIINQMSNQIRDPSGNIINLYNDLINNNPNILDPSGNFINPNNLLSSYIFNAFNTF